MRAGRRPARALPSGRARGGGPAASAAAPPATEPVVSAAVADEHPAAGTPAVPAAPRKRDRPDDPRAERRRETDPLRVVPVLDGARGYALVMVVFYHCWIAAF